MSRKIAMSGQSRLSIDILVEILKDGDCHSIDEMLAGLRVPEEKLLLALHFLAEYSIAEFAEEWREARITPRVKTWLESLAEAEAQSS